MSLPRAPLSRLPAGFAGMALTHQYRQLPAHFYSDVMPTPVPRPERIAINRDLALELALDPDALASAEGIALLAGNSLPHDAQPLAQAYAGHQFGHFNPRLGDGRALLLGELRDASGTHRDLQLKGAGPTPYSRGGDGRAALGPVIREYVVSEAMHRLGIKTTRVLAAVTSGAHVYRDTALPGAVLTRVANSHIRIGTFEYFRAHHSADELRALADWVIHRHYPDLRDSEAPYSDLLHQVQQAQIELVVSWLLVGFIHGVMNTDNTSICGETLDYGPCAFMDHYDPATVFSAIDTQGRYAYANQARIALWNLTRFAECLLPLMHPDTDKAVELAQTILARYTPAFQDRWQMGMARKIGLQQILPGDAELIDALLTLMHQQELDYTLTFRALADLSSPGSEAGTELPPPFEHCLPLKNPAFSQWLSRWHLRLQQETATPEAPAELMRAVNPLVIPRNHQIERIIQAAMAHDYAPMHELIATLQQPYNDHRDKHRFAMPPKSNERVYQTFCGT